MIAEHTSATSDAVCKLCGLVSVFHNAFDLTMKDVDKMMPRKEAKV